MYINGLRQHILIAGITFILTVWVFLLLFRMFDKQVEKDYPPLNQGDIFIEKSQIDQRALSGGVEENIRSEIMNNLLAFGFSGFVSKPYENMSGDVHITTVDKHFSGDLVVESLIPGDPLDIIISDFLTTYNDTEYQVNKKPFHLGVEEWSSWSGVLLFANIQDIEKLGYEVVSHRTRKNTDAGYRRHNISTALKEFGAVRVVMPGEEISFIDEINFDPLEQELYQRGFTVVLDEDQTEYGGGLCGASTALYQGLLTNTAVESQERRAHTQRRTNLYTATINGERISSPGLDSTIYDGHIDYKIINTAPYPIIIVANYDGSRGGIEEVFSLAKSENKGDFEYNYTRRNSSYVVIDGIRKLVRGGCYGWIVNGEERESCYKSVN